MLYDDLYNECHILYNVAMYNIMFIILYNKVYPHFH